MKSDLAEKECRAIFGYEWCKTVVGNSKSCSKVHVPSDWKGKKVFVVKMDD